VSFHEALKDEKRGTLADFSLDSRSLNKSSIVSALKGPKHEIFESGFFTQIRGLWLGDFRTGEIN
jgi:hypothetical protein